MKAVEDPVTSLHLTSVNDRVDLTFIHALEITMIDAMVSTTEIVIMKIEVVKVSGPVAVEEMTATTEVREVVITIEVAGVGIIVITIGRPVDATITSGVVTEATAHAVVTFQEIPGAEMAAIEAHEEEMVVLEVQEVET